MESAFLSDPLPVRHIGQNPQHPDASPEEETGFCGESPDEVALVEAAKAAGCVLEGREAIAGAVVHRVRAPDCSLQENELRPGVSEREGVLESTHAGPTLRP